MINILKFDYTPKAVCWVHQAGAGQTLLAVSDVNSSAIRIYDGRGDGKPLHTLDKIHRAPVHVMTVSRPYNSGRAMLIYSTLASTTVSSRQTSKVSSSTGNLANRGVSPPSRACGLSSPLPTCSTSKRYVLLSSAPSVCGYPGTVADAGRMRARLYPVPGSLREGEEGSSSDEVKVMDMLASDAEGRMGR